MALQVANRWTCRLAESGGNIEAAMKPGKDADREIQERSISSSLTRYLDLIRKEQVVQRSWRSGTLHLCLDVVIDVSTQEYMECVVRALVKMKRVGKTRC